MKSSHEDYEVACNVLRSMPAGDLIDLHDKLHPRSKSYYEEQSPSRTHLQNKILKKVTNYRHLYSTLNEEFKSPWAPSWNKKQETTQLAVMGAKVRINTGPYKGHTGEVMKTLRGGVNLRVKHKDDSSALYHKNDVDYIKEEAPTNATGSGDIAGLGVGPSGEPGIKKTKYKAKNQKDTAVLKDMLKRKMT